MTTFEDCESLVERSKELLKEINYYYDNSITEAQITKKLLICIKNFCENLHSALDYLAFEIYSKYCKKANKNVKIYFPYANKSTLQNQFEKQLKKKFVGLKENNLDIYNYFISIQHFTNKDSDWLEKIISLNNKNKHQRLMPQIIKKHVKLKISSGVTSISMLGASKIVIEDGASVKIGNIQINGKKILSSDSVPNIPSGHVEMKKWESIHFEYNDEEVMPLLQKSLNGTAKIIADFKRIMN
jgi:hypothetical protein